MLGLLGQMVQLALPVQRGPRVIQGRQVQRGQRGQQELPDLLDEQVRQDLRVGQELLVPPALPEHPEQQDLQEQPVLQAQLD